MWPVVLLICGWWIARAIGWGVAGIALLVAAALVVVSALDDYAMRRRSERRHRGEIYRW